MLTARRVSPGGCYLRDLDDECLHQSHLAPPWPSPQASFPGVTLGHTRLQLLTTTALTSLGPDWRDRRHGPCPAPLPRSQSQPGQTTGDQ